MRSFFATDNIIEGYITLHFGETGHVYPKVAFSAYFDTAALHHNRVNVNVIEKRPAMGIKGCWTCRGDSTSYEMRPFSKINGLIPMQSARSNATLADLIAATVSRRGGYVKATACSFRGLGMVTEEE